MKINGDLFISETDKQLKDVITTAYGTEGIPCKIGTWRGKPIYRIILNLGHLPDGTQQKTKTFTYELPNFYEFLNANWFAYDSSTRLSLPYVYPDINFIDYWITLDIITNNSITVVCGTNRSDYRLWGIFDYVATEEITS